VILVLFTVVRIFDQGVGHRTDPEFPTGSISVPVHQGVNLDKRT
jgi:hypothetical protein